MKPVTFSLKNLRERSSEIEIELLCALATGTADEVDVKEAIATWYDNVGILLMATPGVPTQKELNRANDTISDMWEKLERISKPKKAKVAVE